MHEAYHASKWLLGFSMGQKLIKVRGGNNIYIYIYIIYVCIGLTGKTV